MMTAEKTRIYALVKSSRQKKLDNRIEIVYLTFRREEYDYFD